MTGTIEKPYPPAWPRRTNLACLVLLLGWLASGCSKPDSAQPPKVDQTKLDRFQIALLNKARQSVVESPMSGEAWGKLGQQYHALEYLKEARFCYEQALLHEPASCRWHHLLGLLQLQDFPDQATIHLTQAMELCGEETDAPRLRLAQALVEWGRYEQALTHLQALLALDANHAAARLELARIRLAENALAEAGQLLSVCLTNRHTARPALILMSQVQHRLSNPDQATRLANQAARMPRPFDWPDPFLREVQSLAADRQKLQDHINGLLMQNRTEEAESALANLFKLFPNDTDGLLLLGRLRFMQRQCPEAEQAFRQHLQASPDSLNGHIQLSLALLCQQRWADAEAVLRKAIRIKPDFAEAHFNLGYALEHQGKSDDAVASYQDALRCRPGHVGAYLALAEEFLKRGQRDDARENLDRARALNPGHPKVRQLAEILEAQP